MSKIIQVKFLIVLFTFMFSINFQFLAQDNPQIISVKTSEPKEGAPLTFTVGLLQPNLFSNVLLATRKVGDTEYRYTEMVIRGTDAEVTIPSDLISSPYIEYFVLLEFSEDKKETHPLGMPESENALRVFLQSESPKDREIIFLNPDRSLLSIQDYAIILSLLRADDSVDKSATKLFINNVDVSEYSVIAGDLVIFNPKNFSQFSTPGLKTVRVELYTNDGNLYHSVINSFTVSMLDATTLAAEEFRYKLNFQAESRNEDYGINNTWYNNFSTRFNGQYDWLKFFGNLYLTSEEKNNLQPQHRYLVTVESDYFRFSFGDNFPRLNNLILDGKRVRGFSGKVNYGIVNIETVIGETERSIEGELLELFSRANAPIASNVVAIDSAAYGEPFGRISFGTYKRNLFALRPYLKSGESFMFGLTYLHSKDDMNSIKFSAKPRENLVIGTDLSLGFDDQRIMFNSQAAFSLTNNDISTGTFDDALIDSLFGSGKPFGGDPETIRKLRDIAQNFITVNQFISPLNPEKLPTLAAEASVALNYFDNYLRASYIYRGNEYHSFGQSFLRTDVSGLNIMDRLRLLDNQLFLTLSYERLQDNLQKIKLSTTTFQTINSSVTYMPRIDFPSLTVGYLRINNKNDLNITDPDSLLRLNAIDDITNRFLFQVSYGFNLYVSHQASLSFTNSVRDDNSLRNLTAKTNSVMLTLNTRWQPALSSYFNLNINASDISGTKFDYVTLSVGGRYRLFDNALELSAGISPSFGDFERQAIDVGAQYMVIKNLYLLFQFRYFNYPQLNNASIVGLTARYEM